MDEHSVTQPALLTSRRPSLRAFGGYEIEGELGRGGMGVVYLARQVELNRRVALKMLTGHYGADELHRFQEEAETAAGLHHTNILHIYEVGEHEGAPFFSMEYIEGGTLGDRLRKGMLAPRQAAQLLIHIARALHYAHQNGVVHRDMKPANVLLDSDDIPKVADFGIAKRLQADSQLTRSGAVIGTPTYMAPEQAKGNSRHVGPAADVYSLGAILYEMLAGRPPFLPEDSEASITLRVLNEDPVSPAWHRPDIPRDLETICMKCLEKEPRNRYLSAAALAEDLRRFLDDEPILARPPSTIGSSIKWVRRHPWKFVAAVTALFLIVAGSVRLAQWEMYQRPHLEYASLVEWSNGSLEPIERISQADGAQRGGYLRLTRRGRYGPIIKVEALNARGYPAVLRQILVDDMLPVYIERLMGAQPYSESRPETNIVELLYDDKDNAVEAVGRDRNAHVNWRILYDRRSDAGPSGRTARARFVDARGFDAASRGGASQMEFERDAAGRDVQIRFFNNFGKPAPNGEGVYGCTLERDGTGHITRLVNLGPDGQPAPNRVGLIEFAISWGIEHNGGKANRIEIRDGNGQPTLWKGIAAFVFELDDKGNAMRTINVGADEQPVRDGAAPWSAVELQRNEHGELTQRVYLKADADGSLKQILQNDISYNDYGHPSEMKTIGAGAGWTAWQRDEKGNITEEKTLDAAGQPITNEKGYAITRFTYTSGPQGFRVEQTYFDVNGAETYNKDGYHRLINDYDVAGALRQMAYAEYDPARFKYYRFVSEPEYDPQGRLRHMINRYEDARGELAANAGLTFIASEVTYDDNGKVFAEWRTFSDPKDYGASFLRLDTEWQANGKMKRRVQQFCDANRQPLPVLPSGYGAHKEEEFDANEQRERVYETGFDEALVGFSAREAKYSAGALQSVTHTRHDGTALNAVRVIIASITPPPGQPKSAELKVGDRLIAANGKAVTSTQGWIAAGNFPGGWLEVLREGRRIRIDGFGPGDLGFLLQDRAPAAP
jgi:serine/threonine protein kinase